MTPDSTGQCDPLREHEVDASALLHSRWVHIALLTAASLAAWLTYGFQNAPISSDQAYFTYMGQAIARGEPIYSETFVSYTPLGSLTSAASMIVGGWAGMPTYLAPRYAAVAVGVLSVLLVYGITRRATGSAWSGIVAGLVLAGIERLGVSYLSTLQHKHLVIFLTLLTAAACQRRRWGLAGLAAGLATSTYQSAILVPLGFGIIACWNGLQEGIRKPLRFAVGVVGGLLPIVLYLAVTGEWRDFWLRTVEILVAGRAPKSGSSPGHWIDVLNRAYRTDLPFLWMAAAGWIGFGVQSIVRGWQQSVNTWLSPRFAGMPLLALLFCISATLEFQGHPDAYPLMPFAAFWSAWFVHWMVELAVGTLRLRTRTSVGLITAMILIVAGLSFRDVRPLSRGYTLDQQLELVQRIWGTTQSIGPSAQPEPDAPERPVVALFAEEVYVLAERPSPYPFLRLPGLFVPFLPHVGLRNCQHVAAEILDSRPRAVALRIRPMLMGCEPFVGHLLSKRGYRRTNELGLTIFWDP